MPFLKELPPELVEDADAKDKEPLNPDAGKKMFDVLRSASIENFHAVVKVMCLRRAKDFVLYYCSATNVKSAVLPQKA